MNTPHWLTLTLLAGLFSVSTLTHAMPHDGSVVETSALPRRDDVANYGILPKDTTNKNQAKAITALLQGMVSDPTKIYTSDTDKRTLFWSASLTSDNVKKLESDENVGAVIQECTTECPDPTESDDQGDSSKSRLSDESVHYKGIPRLRKRDFGYINSPSAGKEMAFISLPENRNINEYHDFVYDQTAGMGVNLYIVDTGASLSNTEEFPKHLNTSWIQATGSAATRDTTENDSKGIGHGTGVLAKAAGWRHGIAKRSNPVIVRIAKWEDPLAWLDGVRQVYLGWKPFYDSDPKNATAVMNMSWGWSRKALQKAGLDTDRQNTWIAELKDILSDCINIGILPIAPSGNSPSVDAQPLNNPPVDQWPQLFAYDNSSDVQNMMVVGGVDLDGNRWVRSKVDPDGFVKVIKVHAPCVDLTIPDAKSGKYRKTSEVQGVSFASAAVAGLGAYFLKLPSLSANLIADNAVRRVQRLKQQLEVGAVIRKGDGDVQSLWNLADPLICPPYGPTPSSQDGDEVVCKDLSTNQRNNVVVIPKCYITTSSANAGQGITAAVPGCSCEGGTIAGVGSGVVSGTTYSWCQTGDLPSGVPTEAAAHPVTSDPTVTSAPPAITSPPNRVRPAS